MRQEVDSDISNPEMRAVHLAFSAFQESVMGLSVVLRLDIPTVVPDKQRHHRSSSVRSGKTDHQLDGDSRHDDVSKIHPRKKDRDGKLIKPAQRSDSNKVFSQHLSFEGDLSGVQKTNGGLIRHELEQLVTIMLYISRRLHGMEARLRAMSMGRP